MKEGRYSLVQFQIALFNLTQIESYKAKYMHDP